MSFLEIEGLTKRFRGAHVLRKVSLRVERGECFGLIGPSGAGKTTLLRLVAGLESPDEGTVVLDGQRLSTPGRVEPPEKRGIGMVFQTLGLWAHLDARSHIDVVLRARLARRAARAEEVERLLAMARLADKAQRRPGEMSGGERQRLAFARSVAPRPRLLLLDEPFAHVDAPLRDELGADLSALIRASETTVALVSHDGPHVASLCPRIALLNNGRIEQIGSPQELYDWPRTGAGARMMGPAFLIEGTAREGKAKTAIGSIALRDGKAAGAGFVCLRPESFRLAPGEGSAQAEEAWRAQVSGSAFVAGRWRTDFQLNGWEFWTWTEARQAAGEAAAAQISPAAWIRPAAAGDLEAVQRAPRL